MKVYEFKEQFDFLIEHKLIKLEDDILIVGSGNKKTDLLHHILLPSIKKVNKKIKQKLDGAKQENKGFYNIGFYREE